MTSRRGLSASTADTNREGKQPIYYPYYCRALSPTLGRWCPLKASDVLRLRRVDRFGDPDLWFYGNHMIKYVRLVGVVVAVEEFMGVYVYTLDDGCGVNIEATCAAPPKEPALPTVGNATAPAPAPVVPTDKGGGSGKDGQGKEEAPTQLISPDGPNLTDIDVGSVVKMKGTVMVFREQIKIQLKAITVIQDTNSEVKCWNEVVMFRREVLANPWVVTKEQERKCREDEDTEAKIKREEEAKRRKVEMRKRGKERERGEERSRRGRDRDVHKENRSIRGSDRDRGKEMEMEMEARTSKQKTSRGLDSRNRVNFPSRAARLRAAGKYDALGI